MTARSKPVTLLGIGDDGCLGLTGRALGALAKAQVLVGGERHLAFFPDFPGEVLPLKGGITAALDRVRELAEDRNVLVLASGDPLFFGVGGLLLQRLGAEHVDVIPHPSSVQWAFARVGLPWERAAFISLHGRDRRGFIARLRQARRAAVLTDETNHPRALAAHLLAHGQGGWKAWVCEHLGGAGERVRAFTLEALAEAEDIRPLNVLLLERAEAAWRPEPRLPFLHEDAFAKRMPKKGLITKREVRALSLAALRIRPDAVLWDIGAGSGSVAIEAAMLAPEGRVYAIETDPEGVEICKENVLAHGADNVEVIHGRAPEACEALEDPDAVFVGGSKGSMEGIVAMALDRLRPGGRLVVNAITLENAAESYRAVRARGLEPEVLQLNVARAEKLATYMRFEAMNPIQILAVEKP